VAIEVRPTSRGPRYKVRLRRPDGSEYARTFRTRKEAAAFQAAEQADQARGHWTDPTAGREALGAYADRWLTARVNLKPRTRELYEGLLRLHILPQLGGYRLGRLTPDVVRTWHAERTRAAMPGSPTPAKAYRLLKTILGTAEADGLIGRNPCSLRSVGAERAVERPMASVEEVWALADAVKPVRRVMVLVAGFMGLRLGELLGLQRRHVDLTRLTITVEQQLQQVGTRVMVGTPKSQAGYRTVHIPPVLVPTSSSTSSAGRSPVWAASSSSAREALTSAGRTGRRSGRPPAGRSARTASASTTSATLPTCSRPRCPA